MVSRISVAVIVLCLFIDITPDRRHILVGSQRFRVDWVANTILGREAFEGGKQNCSECNTYGSCEWEGNPAGESSFVAEGLPTV